MNFPEELRYTKSHEWAKRDGRRVIVGISDYAQKEISDVVFVELPKVGKETQQFKPAAVVESVKAAFDIYAPVSGKVIKANSDLESLNFHRAWQRVTGPAQEPAKVGPRGAKPSARFVQAPRFVALTARQRPAPAR